MSSYKDSPKGTGQAWSSLYGSSCSVVLCRLLSFWPIQIRKTVCILLGSFFSFSYRSSNLSILFFSSMFAAAGLTGIAASWNTKPSNWVGNDPCGDKWVGILCIQDRVTSMLAPVPEIYIRLRIYFSCNHIGWDYEH